MGVIRAGNLETVGQSNAQIITGSLVIEGSKNQKLERTPSFVGNNRTWTFSTWVKKPKVNDGQDMIFTAGTGEAVRTQFYFNGDELWFYHTESPEGTNSILVSGSSLFRDVSAWYHILLVCDIPNGYVKAYVNNRLEINKTDVNTSYITQVNLAHKHAIGNHSFAAYNNPFSASFSNTYLIDGQALDPSYFGYTDPLTNTWRPKKYVRTTTITGDTGSAVGFGTNGFWLPFDGNSPIGKDMSGKGNDWTPVNFGGTNTIEKATGALPILNTDGGGKVARVGVRTDSNASSLVLALPLVGIKSDFSNKINSGTTEKAITVNGGASGISTVSNFYGGSFYFDGNADYIDVAASSDFAFGTGDFTVECWIYTTNTTADTFYRRVYLTDGPTGNANGNFQIALEPTTGKVNLWDGGAGGLNILGNSNVCNGVWHHIAGCRSGSTLRLFVDGVLETSTTYSDSISPNSGTPRPRIGSYNGTTGDFDGYIQDVRIYKGLAKYTQNFIPASTDPDILPDTPSGVAYSSNVALVPSTDGAVAFDNNGDYLSLASSSDFALGTNDWTIEWFAYPTSNAQYQRPFYLQGSNVNTIDGVYTDGTGIAFGRTNVWASSTATNPLNRWNHYALVHDSTNMRLYINGVQVLTDSNNFGTDASKSLNIAYSNSTFGGYFAGQISNFHIVKDQALYTSNFTPPTAPITSVANTKLLCCKSQTSATAADVTPGTITANGNAAATNFNPFTVNINTQRGKQSGYATLNPLASNSSATISNGNLNYTHSGAGAWQTSHASVGIETGKIYFEVNVTSTTSNNAMVGVSDGRTLTNYSGVVYAWGDGNTLITDEGGGNAVSQGTVATSTVGDTIGVAVNKDNSQITFYKNGISLISISSVPTWAKFPSVTAYSGGGMSVNFGQKPFKFPPPAGFQPLALANTPRPTIVRPDQYVGIVTYTGNGTSQSINVGFKPDFVWIKSRSNNFGHWLTDSVRGVSKQLQSNSTGTEQSYDMLTSFNSNGFSLGTDDAVNGNTYTHVAWCWKAGGAIGVGRSFMIDNVGFATAGDAGMNTGTITPTGASVNTKSGFSIITYTGTGANATISHGLGQTPSFLIVKSRTLSPSEWNCYHISIGNTKRIKLNATTGEQVNANAWNNTTPTSSVFSVGTETDVNSLNDTYVAYCWAEIPGFSKFGSYSGNGSTDGTVVVTGFRPRWVLIKRTDATATNWMLRDSTRSTYNVINTTLAPNVTTAESGIGDIPIDFLSNGFKLRDSSSVQNASNVTYIYAAFAESPSFNLYGGQSNAR